MPILAGGIDLLSVNPGLAIWTVVTFLVVLTVLWIFAWRPIVQALDARNAKVEDDLETSKQLREKAEELLNDYEDKMETVRSEALHLIEEGKKDAEINGDRIIKEAQQESDRLKDRVQKDIEQAKLKALDELETKVVDIAIDVVSRVLKKDISDKEHKEIIIKELEAFKSGN